MTTETKPRRPLTAGRAIDKIAAINASRAERVNAKLIQVEAALTQRIAFRDRTRIVAMLAELDAPGRAVVFAAIPETADVWEALGPTNGTPIDPGQPEDFEADTATEEDSLPPGAREYQPGPAARAARGAR